MAMKDNLMLHFDFGTVFQRTKEFIDLYNSGQTQLTKKLNANHRASAELIIRLYLKQLNRAAQLQEIDPHDLPGFATYNSSLAKCKGCTKRTIINHKERLAQAGFIIREQHVGKSGVEIWINPEVLGVAKISNQFGGDILKIGDLTHRFLDKAKNFHPLVHEQQEHLNNNSTVDKSGVPSGHESGLDKSETTGTRHEQNKNTEENANPASKKQERIPKKQPCAEKQEQNAEAGRIFLLSLIRQFWDYARRVLYPDLIISEPEEREILNLIWGSVFGKLHWNATEKEWIAYQETTFNRLNMVARWLARSSGHWIPKPHIYFHPNNDRNGFKKTWQWYIKQETLKVEVRNQLLLQHIKAEWQQYGQGKGRFREKTRLQLFRIQQKRLSQYKDESLMQSYQQSLKQSLQLHKLQQNASRTNAT